MGALDWLLLAQGGYVLALAIVIMWRYLCRSFSDPVRSAHVLFMALSYGILTAIVLAVVAGIYTDTWGKPMAFVGFGFGDVALLAFLYWIKPTAQPMGRVYGRQ